jgi:hypothetical protein
MSGLQAAPGRGAGRSAKYYEPSNLQIEVSIPPRRYDLAGELLLQSVLSEGPRERARVAALRVARTRGNDLGTTVRRERKLRPLGPERASPSPATSSTSTASSLIRTSAGCSRSATAHSTL